MFGKMLSPYDWPQGPNKLGIAHKRGPNRMFLPSKKREAAELTEEIARLRSSGPIKLHLGCGSTNFDGYINVDYPSSSHNVMAVKPDVACDITKIDLAPASVDEIRLHHVFEHFNRAVAIGLLIRWQSWLKIGGKLVIETPDFAASARAFANATSLNERLRHIRHLEGDQADHWAYHVGQWFPERFVSTLEMLGFDNVECREEKSGHEPPLFNVVISASKSETRSMSEQLEAADRILANFMVAEAERPTWEVWRSQVRSFLNGGKPPSLTINHPAARVE